MSARPSFSADAPCPFVVEPLSLEMLYMELEMPPSKPQRPQKPSQPAPPPGASSGVVRVPDHPQPRYASRAVFCTPSSYDAVVGPLSADGWRIAAVVAGTGRVNDDLPPGPGWWVFLEKAS